MQDRSGWFLIYDPSIQDAFQEFLEEKRTMNLSEETIREYTVHTKQFIDISSIRHVSEVNKEAYQAFVDSLKEDKKKNDVTVASYCRSIRVFLYWLMENEYIHPFKIRIPKYQTKIKRCYQDDELRILLKKPQRHCSETEYISWVFVNLICATGIRLKSARNIKVSDIQDDWIMIDRTKNKHGLRLHLNPDLQRILRRYINAFHLRMDDYLFCTAEGVQYTTYAMEKMIERYNKNRGIGQTGIHRMRHTFARNYYMQTKDVYALSKLLGHSSVAVTEIYLRDLGMETFCSKMDYNSQQQFSQSMRRRRGKMR